MKSFVLRWGGRICISLFLMSLFGTGLARAESIKSFSNEVSINLNGQASFLETIQYDLPSDRHGIYRDIPISSKLPDGKYLNYTLNVEKVTRGGDTEPFEIISNGSYKQLKIGSAEKTLSGGVQTYAIGYSLEPFVRHDTAGDYITINIHGTMWDFVADKVTGTVTLPEGVEVQSQKCFTGSQGEEGSNCTVSQISDNKIEVKSNGPLQPNNGLTVDLVVPADSFNEAAYLVPSDSGPASDGKGSNPFAIGAVIFSILVVVSVFALLVIRTIRGYLRRQKNRKAQSIVAQYEAPEKMLPGEVGLIHDEKADTREVTATLIDLARRGHLKITYEEKKQLIGKKDRFKLDKLESKDPLEAFEKLLFDGVFATGPSVYVDELQAATMSTVVNSMKLDLENRMKTKGWYLKDAKFMNAENLSPEGYRVWAQAEGLKLYLNVAEKDRMAFAEAPEKTPDRFTKLLPFAIALGVEKEWAKQFEGIDITPATQNWYAGNNVGNSILFTNFISSSFASNINANFSPPSSSGGSGGGFSGGGGGGGGGGSW